MKYRQPLLVIIAVIALHQVVGAQSGAPAPPAPKPDQTVRLSAGLIQVRAVVTDKHGRVIDQLKKDDFVPLWLIICSNVV